MTTPLETTAEPAIKKQLSIKVWGVGGAGCNALGALDSLALPGVDLLALNTDCQALEACAVPNRHVLGARRTRGLGAGGDPELGRAAAEEDLDKLRGFCAGTDIIFILAGLGGGTGTGAAPILAKMARECGALVLAIVTIPFEFEGTRRHHQAQAGLRDLEAAADAVICLPNHKVFKMLDENTGVVEGIKISNALLAQGVHGIWRLLSQPGLINVDFADLCSVTRGRHGASSFATAEGSGEGRVDQVAEKLLAHPLLDGGQVLSDSDVVLVSLVGGPDLTMAEINKVMEPLNRQCENAHIILGAAIDEQFTNRLSVTLIASCRRVEEKRTSATRDSSLHFLNTNTANESRPTSRFVAPPPEMTLEQKQQLLESQTSRSRRKPSRQQRELPLEIVYKGRFEKSEPTIRHGEDLDVPTYIRRGVPLN